MYIQAPTTLKYPLGVLPTFNSPMEGDTLLMTGSKFSKWGYSRVEMSLDTKCSDFDPNGFNYLGCVHASLSGLDHSIVSPFKSSAHKDGGLRELAAVSYTQNRIGSLSGPRRMSVVLPGVEEMEEGFSNSSNSSIGVGIVCSEIGDSDSDDDSEDGVDAAKYVTKVYRPKTKSDQLVSVLRKGETAVKAHNEGLFFGKNKEPYWLDNIQAYSLDFQGRVTLPSNKNFQLELSGSGTDLNMPSDLIYMQFGKVVSPEETESCSIYTVDFQWPMSPLQVFGISITACDRKLGCA